MNHSFEVVLYVPCLESEFLFFQTLEACMKHCGRRFHQEVGKFRFLNEIIKVISPKVGTYKGLA